MTDLNKAIVTTVKTGKVSFGINNTITNAKTGKAKLVIVAANCPLKTRETIEYYCNLSQIPIEFYKGSSTDLGSLCGKPFTVSALTIKDPGDSDILTLAEITNV